MAKDLLHAATSRNFDQIESARIESSHERVVLRLSVKGALSPHWLERLVIVLVTDSGARFVCAPQWDEQDGSLISATLLLNGARPPVDMGDRSLFSEVDKVDMVALCSASSAKNLINQSSRHEFQTRDTLPDSRR